MANKVIKGLTIQIGADTVGLNNALKSMESATKKAQSELREVDKTIKASGESAVLWEQKQKLINTALDESKKKLKLLEDAQEQVNKQVKDGKISEEQYRAFQREVEYARAEVGKYENQLTQANSKLREFGTETDRAADETAELSKETAEASEQTVRASEGFTVMKGVLANLVTDGIRFAARELKELTTDVIQTGAAFEAAMGQVAAISQASASEVEQLSNKAKEMGATTKFTAEQSAEAFNYMAMAGWKTEDMLNGIDGILGLAAASGEDLGTTSDIVTDALTAFGLKAADAGHFADVMAAASSNANTNVSMMGETFKYVAPIAGALNFSIEDTAEAIGIMANSGIKASQAGTSLRTIMTNLTGGIEIASDAIGEVTVETENADGSMRSLSDILTDLRGVFDHLSESEKANWAETIAGKNAMSGFLALVNAAPEDIDKLSGAIENCDGAAQGMADTMMDNLAGDITLFESAVDGAKIKLSDELQPALRDVVRYATEQVPKAEKLLEPLFRKGAEAVKVLLKNLPEIIRKGKELIPVITGVGTAFATWKVLEKASKAVSVISATATALNGVGIAASAASLGIVGVVAALAIGAGSYVYAAHKAHEAHLEEVFDTARESTIKLTDSVNDNIKAMSELKDQADKQVETDKVMIDRTKNLADELDGLVDANGNVKAGYEDRVNYIVKELSQATGLEIDYVNGQIQKYSELKQAIEDVISRKRAESMQSAYTDVYQQALLRNSQAADDYAEIEKNINRNKYEIQRLRESAERAAAEEGKTTSHLGEFTSANADDWIRFLGESGLEKLKAAEENIIDSEKALELLRNEYAQNTSVVEEYEKAVSLMCDNNYDAAVRMFSNIGNAEYSALINSKGNIEKQKRAFYTAIVEAEKKYNAALSLGDKTARKTFSGTVADITKQAEEGGVSAGELLSTGIVNRLSMIDGFDISALLDFCSSAGITLGDALASASTERIQELLSPIASSIEFFSSSRSSASQLFAKGLDKAFGDVLDKYFYADGGTLREGQGIVAEAGPELIRINNGTAHITPLTRGAHSTPITSTGKQTVIYNSITVNAAVSNDYDAYRLGERIAAAQKNVNVGKGLA